MSIYDDIRAEIKELVELVKLDERYSTSVGHGLIKADQESSRAHQVRAARVSELSRKYGLL